MFSAETTGQKAALTGNWRSEFIAERRNVGERLKLARGRVSLTQAQLAKILGITRGAVAQWETGVGVPATERLVIVADLFDVSLDWLLGRPRQTDRPKPAGPSIADDLRLLEEARRLGVDLPRIVAEASRASTPCPTEAQPPVTA